MFQVTDAQARQLHALLEPIPGYLRELGVEHADRAAAAKFLGDQLRREYFKHKHQHLIELAATLEELVLPFKPAPRTKNPEVLQAKRLHAINR